MNVQWVHMNVAATVIAQIPMDHTGVTVMKVTEALTTALTLMNAQKTYMTVIGGLIV